MTNPDVTQSPLIANKNKSILNMEQPRLNDKGVTGIK